MASRLGQRLGNYKLVKSLGHGGFADVYLAEQIYLKTQAAIKVLNSRLAPVDLLGFRKEARTLANLHHAYIIRVLEFGIEDGNTPYLVMDYAPGGSLVERHPRGLCLTPVSYTHLTLP